MNDSPYRVFLDANIVIQDGKPPGGQVMGSIREAVKAKLISIVTTDLTIIEISKKHAENDHKALNAIANHNFRDLANEHFGIILPETDSVSLRKILRKKYDKSVAEFFSSVSAEIRHIDEVKPSEILGNYSNFLGIFNGEAKKDQFPDAFIYATLKASASDKNPLVIVSADKDFASAAKNEKWIKVFDSVKSLFAELGLSTESAQISEFIEKHMNEIREHVDDELKNWGLQIYDIEDAEVEDTSVVEIELSDVSSFWKASRDGVIVFGIVSMTVDVEYNHPDWDNAAYDSEDKILIPFDQANGKSTINMDARFSMTINVGKDGAPTKIDEVTFRNDDFVYIGVNFYDDYK